MAESLKPIVETLERIEMRLEKLEFSEKVVKKPIDPSFPSPEIEPDSKESKPAPENPEFRGLVDKILNKHFTFEIEPDSNPSFFTFVLLVPRRYSNADGGTWDLYHKDARPKGIPANDPMPILEEHLKMVLRNLGPEIGALVINDR